MSEAHAVVFDLLQKGGHKPIRIVRVKTAGDVGDGLGDEVLYTAGKEDHPSVKVARIEGKRILSIKEGW